jgi:hypothetical protein
MRNGTRVGLILIGLAWFVSSTAVNVIALKAAMRQSEQRMESLNPRVMFCCGRVPADARGHEV